MESLNQNEFNVATTQTSFFEFDKLPEELRHYTFQFFSPRDLGNVSLVCRSWKNLANDNLLWKQLALRAFPNVDLKAKNFKEEMKKNIYGFLNGFLEPNYSLRSRMDSNFEAFFQIHESKNPCHVNIAIFDIWPKTIYFDSKGNFLKNVDKIDDKITLKLFLNYCEKTFYIEDLNNKKEKLGKQCDLFLRFENNDNLHISKKIKIYQDYLNQQLNNKIEKIVLENKVFLLSLVNNKQFPFKGYITGRGKIQLNFSTKWELSIQDAEFRLEYDEESHHISMPQFICGYSPGTTCMQQAIRSVILCRTIEVLEKELGYNLKLETLWNFPKRTSNGDLKDLEGFEEYSY